MPLRRPGWREFDGEFYRIPRLEMTPTPPPIPVYTGGLSDIALRRAARNDGWIGDLITVEQAAASVDRIRLLRTENDLGMDDFTVITPLVDAFTYEHYRRAGDAGIGGVLTMPWVFCYGPSPSLSEKIDGMRRFHADFAEG